MKDRSSSWFVIPRSGTRKLRFAGMTALLTAPTLLCQTQNSPLTPARLANGTLAMSTACAPGDSCRNTAGERIDISPAHAQVFAGATVSFSATLSDGTVVTNPGDWLVTGSGSISRGGVYTAPAVPVNDTVMMTWAGVSAIAAVQVISPPAGAISVSLPGGNTGSSAHHIFGVTVSIPDSNGEDPRSLFNWFKVMFATAAGSQPAEKNACEVYWSSNFDHISLASDIGALSPWEFTYAIGQSPGSKTTAANSQCTLFGDTAVVSSSPGGTVINLTFELAFSTAFAGAQSIYARHEALQPDGSVVDAPWTLVGAWTVPAHMPPDVRIAAPLANAVVSGLVTITGAAVDNLTRPETAINPNSLTIYVDNTPLAASGGIVYNRPDPSNMCAGTTRGLSPAYGMNSVAGAAYLAPGCPDTGFSFTWDSTTFSNGLHTLTISAADTDSEGPNTGARSIAVNVNNAAASRSPANPAAAPTLDSAARFATSSRGVHLLTVDAYTYSRAITIDHTSVPNTDQNNFPVLINLTDPLLKSIGNGGHVSSASGYDAIFTSDPGCATKLNHEVELWSATTGQFTAWVRLPRVSHITNTVIYLCYGNSQIRTDQSNSAAVWDANYRAVWHLRNGTLLTPADSTGLSGVLQNSATAGPGQIDGAAVFNANSANYVSFSDANMPSGNSSYTVEAWVYPGGSITGYESLLSWGTLGNTSQMVDIGIAGAGGTGSAPVAVWHWANDHWTSIGIAYNTWTHVAVTYDGTMETATLHPLTGSASSESWTPAPLDLSPGGVVYMGRDLGYRYFWQGTIDEVRVSNIARSADWIAAEYNNQSSPATFYSVGAESGGAPGPVFRAAGPTQAITSFSVTRAAACTIVVFADAARTTPVHDSDAGLFPGSTACNRPGNLVNGSRVDAVLGNRTVQTGADGKAYSRALAQNMHYWARITDLTSSQTQDFDFATPAIPFGQTWNEPLPALEPWISPADASQTIVDPHTGATIQRLTLAKDITSQQMLILTAPAAGSGWTNPANILSEASPAAIAGSTSAIFLPDTDSIVAGNTGTHGKSQVYGDGSGLNALSVTLQAWCSSSSCATASSDERTLQVALSVDGGVTPATKWRDLITTPCVSGCGTGNQVSAGGTAPYLADWISTAQPSFDVSQLAQRGGTFSAIGSTVTWTGGSYYFPPWLSRGARVNLNGAANTIQSVDSDRQITLAAPATSASGNWSVLPFGVLVRKKTASVHQIQAEALSATLTYSISPAWDSAGSVQGNVTCSAVPVQGPGGAGIHCFVGPGLYWVNTATGQRTFLGVAKTPYRAGADGWSSRWCNAVLWSPADGNRATCYAGEGNLIAMSYSGGNADVGPLDYATALSECGAAPCWSFANLAPPSESDDLAHQFTAFSAQTAAFAEQYGMAINFGAIEGKLLEFQVRPAAGNTNNTYGWTALFDPIVGRFVAASPPDRWSGMHGAGPLGVNGWAVLPDVGYRGPITGSDVDGNGPFMALVAAEMGPSDTTACPAWNPASGIAQSDWPTGQNCGILTTDGQPYDPTPGPHEPAGSPKIGNQSGYYLTDVQSGDLICIVSAGAIYDNSNMVKCAEEYQANARDSEFLRVLVVNSDTNWTVQRGYFGPGSNTAPHTFRDHKPGDWIFMMPASCAIGTSGFGCASAFNAWNYATQPSGVTSLNIDWNNRGGGHSFSANGWSVDDVSGAILPWDGDGYWAYGVRSGATVAAIYASANNWVPINAPFAGKLGEGSPNSVDGHPSCTNCDVDNSWFLDMRPFLGDGSLTSCSPVSGTLLKCISSRLRRKYLPTLATAGSAVLQDVSRPLSSISGAPSDAYKYCVAVLAGECHAGSSPGDVYVNAGKSSQTQCTYMGVGWMDADLPSICIGDNGAYTGGLQQTQLQQSLFNVYPPTGAAGRLITTALSRYFWTDQFWNAKATPDGSWALFRTPWAGPRTEAFLVRMPPVSGSATAPGGFTSVAVAVQPTPWARVRFGYDPQFRCSSDGDACLTNGTPWSYSRENPAPEPCSSGCTIDVPAVPGHVLYYRIERTDASGRLLAAGATSVQIP